MEHTNESILVRLADLVPSPFNVRRHSPTSVEELAALIDSQGLLHPLTVNEQPVGKGKSRKLKFAVPAGERRRRALLLLQKRGALPADHEVACKLVPPERAREVSVAENSGREPMHPADEFEAFKALVDEGKGIEDVAARFGVSPLTVQRRLKLAALSPKLLTLYREEGIKDQLMALAVSDDHAAQERVWFEGPQWDRTPAALRRRLTAGEVEAAGNALVRFVGVEAYEAAGGVVRRDLFDNEQARFLADPDFLDRLAVERLEAIAARVREEGWAWVEARIELDSRGLRQFTPCEHTVRKPSAQERVELTELSRRSKELERQGATMQSAQQWSADEAECIALEEQCIEARRRAIHEDLRVWPAPVKARAGAIVTVNHEGDPEVIRGLLREADRKALEASHRKARKAGKEVVPLGDASDEPAEAEGTAPSPTRIAPEFSESLTRRLAAHRTVALQAVIAANVEVALATLAHTLLRRAFIADYCPDRPAMQIHATPSSHAMLSAADDLKQAGRSRAPPGAAR